MYGLPIRGSKKITYYDILNKFVASVSGIYNHWLSKEIQKDNILQYIE